MKDKRRLINQLPAVLQTDTLKNFFAATLDQLVQPGSSEKISGYIGQKPVYYNPVKDFYISEPTDERQEYQLEPGMVSIDNTNTVSASLSYDDLLYYIKSQGGLTNNHSRLFEGDYYSWVPPVDIDKLNNYNHYLWLGSLTESDHYKTQIVLRPPELNYAYDGVQTIYPLPPVINSISKNDEYPVVLINGKRIDAQFDNNGNAIIGVGYINVKDIITTIRYGDISKIISDKSAFDYTKFISWQSTTPGFKNEYTMTGTTGNVQFFVNGEALSRVINFNNTIAQTMNDVIADVNSNTKSLYKLSPVSSNKFSINIADEPVMVVSSGDIKITLNSASPIISVSKKYKVGDLVYTSDHEASYRCVEDHVADTAFYREQSKWAISKNASTVTTGTRLKIIDGIGIRYFFVDGVGTSIVLSEDHSSDPNGRSPLYTIIDRRSNEKSPWSVRNMWVHVDSLMWNGIDYTQSDRKAHRPIIEFLPNIQLFNYGWNRLPDVQAIMSNASVAIYDAWDTQPYDNNVWDSEQIVLSRINGQLFGRQSNALNSGISVDDGYVLQPNDYLFVHQGVSLEPQLNNMIYKVISQVDTPLAYGVTADVIELTLVRVPKRGDIFRHIPGKGAKLISTPNAFSSYTEYWYNGVEWVIAQSASSTPLFALYDSMKNRLDDQLTYLGSNFSGNKLFSYQVGTGDNDPVLGFPLNYDSYANPIFNVDSDIEITKYNGGNVEGYYYHKIISTEVANGISTFVEKYSNNWFAHSSPSSQSLENGIYKIPLNLQANPNNLQVKTISKSQWFDHFSEIMSTQYGFVGQPYTSNNWRDTPKNLSVGTKILQHRSPLLKTMLVSAISTYDVPAAIRYADQEYTRYKNKFIQALITIRQNGTLFDSDPDSLWVKTALDQLKLNKTSDFAFYGSDVCGSNYFIPPTPAYMGLSKVAKPGLVYDFSFSSPVLMLKGHDGSLSPAFGDWRDSKIIAFEQKIYDSISPRFKTESRPLVDLQSRTNSVFYDGGEFYYTSSEINEMLAPYFEKWAQLNKLDYRTNDMYIADDPFSWNYSGTQDVNGNSLPGFWKGIYYYYYDTDRPHLSPWEMLGFVDKPSWWDTEYGPAPYTRGNKKLWDDLRDGRIRSGVRSGIDLRYSRKTLYKFLPVDDEGNLLNPHAANIVDDIPTYNAASAPWKFGDGSPVESMWRRSPSFQFSLAIATFLAKPSRFVEQGWDTINNVQDSTGQWIYNLTGNRPENRQLYIHGEIVNNSYVQKIGVQQWISDYIKSTGQSPEIFGNHIRGLDARLVHKLAGFTTTDNLSIIADNFGKIPAENININLYTSPSIRESFYSGVLIEKVSNGWKVVGYDIRNPKFTIIPPMKNGPTGVISLSTSQEPVVAQWKTNTYHSINTFVQYQNTVYEATKAHMGGNVFDTAYWKNSGIATPPSPRVVTYLYGTDEEVPVPYGTVFNNYQDIADFLLGHERYLVSKGWSFINTDITTQNTINWSSSTEEFLAWAQVNWAVGNFITLSPAASGIEFDAKQGYIFNILQSITGSYGVINRTGSPIDRNDVIVNRIDNKAEIYSKNNDLYGVRVNVGQIEHMLIFDNTTIFGDLIYDPLFNLRQPRLLVIGNKSINWSGILDAPGYILIDGQIKSNFDKSANDLLTMWDIEKSDNAVLRDHARSIIGYDNRNYLESLVISPTQQFEYYQGLIHQKGAPGAFDKLLRSDYIDQNRQLNFFEEWALRLDEYGALSSKERVAFQIKRTDVLRDPQYVQFNVTQNEITTNYDNIDWIQINDSVSSGIDGSWIERPENPLKTFPSRMDFKKQEHNFPISGYVRLDEIDYSVFYGTDLPNIYNAAINHRMYDGEVIWIHENIKTVNIGNASNTWYVIGNFVQNPDSNVNQTSLGYWDGTVDSAVVQSSYLFTDSSGNTVFKSKSNDSPYITNALDFVPVVGQTYTMTFTVKKSVKETNGIPAYLVPAFDGFNNYDVFMQLSATTTGNGYDPVLDAIDTTNWAIDTYYNITVTWTCPESPTFNAVHSRLRLNWNGVTDSIMSNYSNAIFDVLGQNIISQQKLIDWDALKIYNMSEDSSENYIANIVTNREDVTLSTDFIRVYTTNPHGLSAIDINNFVVIDGPTYSNEDLRGVRTISAVGPTFFEIKASSILGFDFSANQSVSMPPVRILRSIHFNNDTEFNVMRNSRIGLKAGDYAYVDGAPNEPWTVYKAFEYTETQSDFEDTPIDVTYIAWDCYRDQPKRIDAEKVSSILLYSLESKITTTDLQARPFALDHMTIISPLCGILPGIAINQLDYITDYDPAQYPYSPPSDVLYKLDTNLQDIYINADIANASGGYGDVNGWGSESVGKLWWDLSKVRFLETETDDVAIDMASTEKYNAEVKYRIKNWGSIAPSCSIDIYQWVRSTIDPITYQIYSDNDITGTYTGTVYNSSNPSYASFEEHDPISGQIITYYYYWVSGMNTTLLNSNKTMSAKTISQYLINPAIEDVPWFAPIMPNGLLIGGANAFLQDTFNQSNAGTLSGTAIQIILEKTEYDGVKHQDWMLLRPHDPRSLPPNWMWDNLKDSLVGFDDRLRPKPKPITLPRPLPNINLPPIWNPPTYIDQPPVAPGLDDGYLDDDIYTRPR